MPFKKGSKTICRHIRDLYKFALQNGYEEIVPKIELIYIMAKKMNRRLNEYLFDGKLPNPDSPGWTEKYWKKELAQCKKCWKKR